MAMRCLPLRGGEWGEVRTLAIGVVPAPEQTPSGEVRRRIEAISYFSRFTTAETFTQRVLVEMHPRGLENAGQVAAVMDGAAWLQGLADHHCPGALRILDFPHAAQRIAAIGQTLWPANSAQAAKTRKPAPDHPWRRAQFGSAKYKQHPKK